MSKIPKATSSYNGCRIKPDLSKLDDVSERKITFSFESIEKNEYFNLDSTCENWSKELFDTMKIVSAIKLKDIHNGTYSREGSTLRIHNHEKVKKPCAIPLNNNVEDMWQIRISKSKGGIHGIFKDNIFYVIWFDPHHNLYPDDKYGGLKKINPPKDCCKDREEQICDLQNQLKKTCEDLEFYKAYAESLDNTEVLK